MKLDLGYEKGVEGRQQQQVKISKASATERPDPKVLRLHKVFQVTCMILDGHKRSQSSLYTKPGVRHTPLNTVMHTLIYQRSCEPQASLIPQLSQVSNQSARATLLPWQQDANMYGKILLPEQQDL